MQTSRSKFISRDLYSLIERAAENTDALGDSNDNSIQELAVCHTRLLAEVFKIKAMAAYLPRAQAGKPWEKLYYKGKTRSEEAYRNRHQRQSEYMQMQHHWNLHNNPRRRTPLVQEIPEKPHRDIPKLESAE